MTARRIELIDALRAFALFGILQVNIQSFAWGSGNPLGQFLQPPSALDAAVYLLVATFVSGKFIAIFGFLFGAGFALQTRARRTPQPGTQATYRRRLVFLFSVGIAHGVLLYFGDILTFYAVCGLLLSAFYSDAGPSGTRPAALARGARRWWIAYVIVILAVTGVFEVLRWLSMPFEGDSSRVPEEALQRLATYTTAGYWEQLPARLTDFFHVLISLAILGIPLVMGLFTLGALAGRQGWLEFPGRHRRVWRVATWLGVAALPVAAWGAWINLHTVVEQPGDPTMISDALMSFGIPVAGLYVALLVRYRDRAPLRRAIAWLAPAGRMPLTNYLMQSVLMGALLSGWGLGLGAELAHAQLAAVALAIVFVQIVASRWWIARFAQGPVEWLWRRATYG